MKPGKIKQYRLSRITTPTRTPSAPPGCPHTGLRAEVTDLLRDAFRATGSTSPADRVKVVLAISPAAWSLVEQRRWGANLKNDLDTNNLPPGWRRLSFVTTGLRECRHWVLSFGAEVRAEHPPALVEWIRDQAKQVFESSPQTGLRTSLIEETPP